MPGIFWYGPNASRRSSESPRKSRELSPAVSTRLLAHNVSFQLPRPGRTLAQPGARERRPSRFLNHLMARNFVTKWFAANAFGLSVALQTIGRQVVGLVVHSLEK